MTPFEFATAGRIVFGEGSAASIPGWAAELGSVVLVVTGRDPGRAESLVEGLQKRDAEVVLLCVDGEPDLAFVSGGAELARRRAVQVVIGIGGGSAIDAAKAIAALAANEGDPIDYLEVVGAGKAIVNAPLPLIAAPTTAGTGSEVTRNAVLSVPARRLKVSLRSPLMLPRLAVIDPVLTYDLPPVHHRHDRPGRADATHRAVSLRSRERDDGCAVPGRDRARGPIARTRMP